MYDRKCKNECDTDTGSICLKQHKTRGYGCTRIKDHKGDHVACGTFTHDVCVWENENDRT